MTDRYTKLTKMIPTTRKNSKNVAHILPEHRVVIHGILSMLLSYNGSQFLSFKVSPSSPQLS